MAQGKGKGKAFLELEGLHQEAQVLAVQVLALVQVLDLVLEELQVAQVLAVQVLEAIESIKQPALVQLLLQQIINRQSQFQLQIIQLR